MTRQAKPRSALLASQLVWVLTILGLLSVTITFLLVQAGLSQFREARVQLTRLHSLDHTHFHHFHRLIFLSTTDIRNNLMDQLVTQQVQMAPENALGQEFNLFLEDLREIELQIPDIRIQNLQTSAASLEEIRQRSRSWLEQFSQNETARLMLDRRTCELLEKLSGEASEFLGQKLLTEAALIRRIHAQHSPTEQMPLQAVQEQATGRVELENFLAEIQSLSVIVARLADRQSPDQLLDLKDNQISGCLHRLKLTCQQLRAIDALHYQPLIPLVQELSELICGSGYSHDQQHQSLQPGQGGLYNLCLRRLTLRDIRSSLRQELNATTEQIEDSRMRLSTQLQKRLNELTQSAEDALSRLRRNMLLVGLLMAGLFLVVSRRIARAIKGHLAAIDQANQALRETTQQLETTANSLGESESRTRLTIESSLDAVLVLDHRGCVTEWNRQARSTFGWTFQEISNQSVLQTLIAPESRSMFRELLEQSRYFRPDQEFNRRMELIFLHRRGYEFPGELSLATLQQNNGQIGFSLFIRDITQRRQTEEIIIQERKLMRTLIDNLSDWVYVKDPASRILLTNQLHLKSLGVATMEEALGKTDFAFYPEHMAAKYYAVEQEVIRSGEPRINYEEVILDTNGQIRWMLTSKIPLKNSQGQVVGLVGSSRDLTEQKRAMELIRGREAAEAANRTKSEFLANMSHEIRTPMTAILGYCRLLADPKTLPADRQNSVQVIQRNGEHLLTIINDILDISKIESGKFKVERINCFLLRLVTEIAALMRGRAQEKKLSFHVRFQGQVPRVIKSDPTRLRQILINLLGNAIKFTHQGSVSLEIQLEEGKLIFRVIDTGIGIDQAFQDHLFEAFSQADASTSRRFGGTGLGMAISKRLAQMLGGDLECLSAVGHGSTFIARIDPGPIASESLLEVPEEVAVESEPPPAPQELHFSGRVLLAEDGPDNQVLISHCLREMGLEVDLAENGQIAYEKALTAMSRSQAYHLILMDMQMPLVDGYSATSKLRKRGYTGPICALTAHAMDSDRQRCLDAGCSHYLSKPVDWDLMGRLLREVLPAGESQTRVAAPPAPLPVPPPVPPPVSSLNAQIQKLLPLFRENLGLRHKELIGAWEKQDSQSLCHLAHQLKGVSGSYGFKHLMALAAEVENRLKTTPPGQMPPDIQEPFNRLREMCLQIHQGHSDTPG